MPHHAIQQLNSGSLAQMPADFAQQPAIEAKENHKAFSLARTKQLRKGEGTLGCRAGDDGRPKAPRAFERSEELSNLRRLAYRQCDRRAIVAADDELINIRSERLQRGHSPERGGAESVDALCFRAKLIVPCG
ncbi:MAG: hypothetical protein ACJAYU_005244 [Bradymonadia bacterium]|jgi:hypothetical protein